MTDFCPCWFCTKKNSCTSIDETDICVAFNEWKGNKDNEISERTV